MTALPCPHCGDVRSEVRDTRSRGTHASVHKMPAIRRRRMCFGCQQAFTTIEVSQEYMDALEGWRVRGAIEQLLKARSVLNLTIEVLTNVGKVKGGLPL